MFRNLAIATIEFVKHVVGHPGFILIRGAEVPNHEVAGKNSPCARWRLHVLLGLKFLIAMLILYICKFSCFNGLAVAVCDLRINRKERLARLLIEEWTIRIIFVHIPNSTREKVKM